jgi:cytochrome c oxidase subunit II
MRRAFAATLLLVACGLIWFQAGSIQPGFGHFGDTRPDGSQQEWKLTMRFLTALPAAMTAMYLSAGVTLAQGLEIIGQPLPGGIAFQPPVTELARDIDWLDNFVFIIITVITVFVTALLLWCAYRFNEKRNPKPATFTHNSPLEIAWTIVPIVILVLIGAFSLPVLFKQQEIPVAEVTIKATGNQWYWSYDYPDSELAFDSYMIGSPFTGGENMLTPDVEAMLQTAGYTRDQWLLATDTAMVVPVNKTVVLQVTGSDVIHAWAMPAFGVMQSGVPGRLSQLWFKAEREGVFFGQCTSLCGPMHAYMPITVKVVSQEAYDKWVEASKASPDGYVAVESVMVAGAAVPATTQVAANN